MIVINDIRYEVTWFSRNGYPIEHMDSRGLDIISLSERVISNFLNNIGPIESEVILDGELLPWSALGRDLILKSFYSVSDLYGQQIHALRDYDYDQALTRLNNKISPHLNKSRKDIESEGVIDVDTWLAYKNMHLEEISNLEDGLNRFNDQLEAYAKEGPLEFVAFQILRRDNETLPNDNTIYNLLNPNEEPCLVLDLNKDSAILIKEYEDYINKLRNNGPIEGTVIKPLEVYKEGPISPYIKHRCEDYLHLVYGPFYQTEGTYEHLRKTKRTKAKLRSSIKEWELGIRLLDMDLMSSEYLRTMGHLIQEEERVAVLDPRL